MSTYTRPSRPAWRTFYFTAVRAPRRLPEVAALVSLALLSLACGTPPRAVAPANDSGGAVPVTESMLRAAPFQSSAITLVGSLSKRSQAWTFQRFTADMRVKGGVPIAFEVVIETGSSAASDASLKQRLEGADLFNPAVRPEATFRTTDLREVSRGGDVTIYAAQGVLALAGRTHAVTLPVEISQVTDGTVARLTTSLDEGGWQTAFGRSAQGIFDERLQLAVRLLFPAAGRR